MLKRIKGFFDNRRKQRFENAETKRKRIFAKLPDKSFSKKLYSFNGIDKEIALLKIGKDVINVSGVRKKNSVNINFQILSELKKKRDLSKATLIHTHPNQNKDVVVLFSPIDLITFCKCNIFFNIRKFEISLTDKNNVEYKRVFIQFSEKTINWIKNNGVKKVAKEIRSMNGPYYSRFIAKPNYILITQIDNFLKEKGITVREQNL